MIGNEICVHKINTHGLRNNIRRDYYRMKMRVIERTQRKTAGGLFG